MGLTVLFVLIGLLGFGVTVREYAHQRRLGREGVRTEGVVVRHRSQKVNDGVAHLAVVNFVDAQGAPHEFEDRSSGVRHLPVGGPAPVLYLPGAPENARVDLPSRRRSALVLPLVAGVGFLACAVAMFAGR